MRRRRRRRRLVLEPIISRWNYINFNPRTLKGLTFVRLHVRPEIARQRELLVAELAGMRLITWKRERESEISVTETFFGSFMQGVAAKRERALIFHCQCNRTFSPRTAPDRWTLPSEGREHLDY